MERYRSVSYGYRQHSAARKRALKHLVKVVNKVLWITGFCVKARSYIKIEDTTNWSFLQMKLNLENDMDNSLIMVGIASQAQQDAAMSKKERVFARLRLYLRTPPKFRTKEDVKQIYGLLRSHAAMQEFPLSVQHSICKNVYWQQYKSRQVIYREGSPMDSFYIILDGVVLLNVMHENENYDQDSPNELNRRKFFPITLEELEGGRSFGSDTDDHKRHHTVVCKTNVALLLLDHDAYASIIKEPFRQKRREDISMLKTMNFFTNYPVQDLYSSDPTTLYSSYYTSGSVIISDIMKSDTFIIVKSGRCRLVMQLGDVDMSNMDRFPHVDVTLQEADKMTGVKQIFPLFYDEVDRENRFRCTSRYMFAKSDDFRASVFSHLSENPKKMTALPDVSTGDLSTARRSHRRRSSSLSLTSAFMRKYGVLGEPPSNDSEKRGKERSIRFNNEAVEETRSRSDSETPKASQTPSETTGSDNLLPLASPYAISQARRRASQRLIKYAAKSPSLPAVREAETEREKTAEEAKTVERSVSYARSNTLPGQNHRGVVQLALLERGSIFGVESLVHTLTNKLGLISDGCECIHFSKRHFLKTASPAVMHNLTNMIVAFPNPEFCVFQVQRAQQWEKYKKSLMVELHEDKRNRKQPFRLRSD